MTDDRETWYRVPRSAEECAVHLEAGGVVEVWRGHWVTLEGSGVRPADFRLPTVAFDANIYRLVYTSPVGMSPVIGAPGHAYGLNQQAPEGWDGRETLIEGDPSTWSPKTRFCAEDIIEARPPAPAPEPEDAPNREAELVKALLHTVEYVGLGTLPAIEGWSWFDALRDEPWFAGWLASMPAPEPRTEKVPLTKLAGRTLVGETERVGRLDPPYGAATWRWRPEWSTLWRLLTVDVETGMVEVLAEEEA